MTRTKFSTLAILSVAALLSSSAAALALDAVATGTVNVRSGPGTGYAKIGVLTAGTEVNVTECSGSWCFVEKPGQDGWVSKSYLAAAGGGGGDDDDDEIPFNFGVTVGPGGPTFSFGIGDAPPPPPAPVVAEVCFFKNNNFAGAHFCASPGDEDEQLIGGWNDSISSVSVAGGAEVTVCRNWWYGGFCTTYSNDKPSLGSNNNKISSYQVF